MITVHISHPITAYETWRQAYDRFADARRRAGVLAERVARPLGPDGDVADTYVVVELDFPDVERAQAFVEFLRSTVWGNAGNAPALAGPPDVCLLEAALTPD